jgi:hypothetical protein
METQLLCTFTNREIYKNTITEIRENYRLVYNYIYVLQNKSNLDELFVTYNVDTQIKVKPLKDTILVHRKKQSNTLYTINALNELVKELNNGILDKNFVINWDDYKNCIIVTNSEGTKKISTRVFEIIEF